MSEDSSQETLQPPSKFFGMLRFAGPGMIVAGSIVGSGELIATTKTGAEAGFVLLWLILLGCVVKVFCQIEFGRYALISGKTTLDALTEVPGPAIKGRGNWLVWYWFIMWFASIGQLGGIVGGVGQSLAISVPLTAQAAAYNEVADLEVKSKMGTVDGAVAVDPAAVEAKWEQYKTQYGFTTSKNKDGVEIQVPNQSSDAKIWAGILAVLTSILLVVGRYKMIQTLSITMVTGFTALTIYNLFMLQGQANWGVKLPEFLSGLSMGLPEAIGDIKPVATALATFGIIGVGASELIVYPYWCLEKGYAKYTGPRDGSAEWLQRAKGWMRVMRLDSWGAMVIYTFSTVVFYLLGAAILNRAGLNPDNDNMVRTLATMFQPVFGGSAAMLFLIGAFAVLYSTYFVANASHARTFADAIRVMGFIKSDSNNVRRWVTILSGVFPLLCFALYVLYPNPVVLVLISGIMQGVMLPMLAGAALFFRYQRKVEGLEPGKLWDLFLWLSAVAMLITGCWTIYAKVT